MPRTNDNAHTPNGDYRKVCQQCGAAFRADDERYKYCSMACYRREHNKRYYKRHAERILLRQRKD